MKTTMTSDDCLRIQKDILSGEDLPKVRKKALREHLKICPECQAFALLQAGIKQRLMADQHDWRPRATILAHLQLHMARKQRDSRRPSGHWLQQVLGYRIPLYQPLMVTILLGLAYWGAVHIQSSLSVKSSPPTGYMIDEIVIETVQAEKVLQVMREQRIGRTINEDTLYSRFTYTM